jgi:hypothetical protein
MGSPAIAAFVGFWAFWVLLVYGYIVDELSVKRVVTFLALWIAGRIVLAYMPGLVAPSLFSPYVAILDIALVFLIFKGDVRLN